MSKKLSKALNFLLCIYMFYYSYRYILKYNAEGTSPTYSDTPLIFQLVKYVFSFAVICFTFLFGILSNISNGRKCQITKFESKINKEKNKYIILMIILLFIQVYQFLLYKNNSVLTLAICFAPFFLIFYYTKTINVYSIKKIFNFFLNFTIIYEFIQILLYFKTGRLPALGYATGIITDVRFGGAWDDPNGFAILLSFYFPYVLNEFDGMKKNIYIAILALMLILTWSLTGIACLVCSYIIYKLYMVLTSKKRKKYFFRFCFLLVAIIVIVVIFFNSSFGKKFINSKLNSIQLHLEGFKLNDLTLMIFLGFESIDKFSEIGYIRLLYQGGIFNVLLFVYFGVASIKKNIVLLKSNYIPKKEKSLYLGMFFYQTSFMLSMFNLPLIYSYANVGIFFIIVLISFVKYENLCCYKYSMV